METTLTNWRLPEPLPHQVPILLSPARKKIVICGRKWGKTPLGMIACLRGHGPQPGRLRGAVDGGNIAWVAPNFTVAADIWRDLKQTCAGNWLEKSEAEHRLDFNLGDVVRNKVMTLDPSLGESERSDYSAIVQMAVTADGAIWVDADIERRDATRISQDAIALARRFQPRWFGVESNGFQKLLAGEMLRASKQAGLMLPIVPILNTEKKVTRIRGLTAYLSRGEIHFMRGSAGAKLLVDQLRGFPLPTVHDDGPDALMMAIDLARELLFGVAEWSDVDCIRVRA